MRFLLDTHVPSEAVKPEADAGLVTWLEDRSTLELCITVLAVGEIRKGILLLPAGRKRDRLHHWLRAELTRQFTDRILPVDQAVSLAWGRLAAEGQRSGRKLSVVDGLLLVAADVHGLRLVTRNEPDCAGRGVPVLNPWSVRPWISLRLPPPWQN